MRIMRGLESGTPILARLLTRLPLGRTSRYRHFCRVLCVLIIVIIYIELGPDLLSIVVTLLGHCLKYGNGWESTRVVSTCAKFN